VVGDIVSSCNRVGAWLHHPVQLRGRLVSVLFPGEMAQAKMLTLCVE
jgi:hypothetical protein